MRKLGPCHLINSLKKISVRLVAVEIDIANYLKLLRVLILIARYTMINLRILQKKKKSCHPNEEKNGNLKPTRKIFLDDHSIEFS